MLSARSLQSELRTGSFEVWHFWRNNCYCIPNTMEIRLWLSASFSQEHLPWLFSARQQELDQRESSDWGFCLVSPAHCFKHLQGSHHYIEEEERCLRKMTRVEHRVVEPLSPGYFRMELTENKLVLCSFSWWNCNDKTCFNPKTTPTPSDLY